MVLCILVLEFFNFFTKFLVVLDELDRLVHIVLEGFDLALLHAYLDALLGDLVSHVGLLSIQFLDDETEGVVGGAELLKVLKGYLKEIWLTLSMMLVSFFISCICKSLGPMSLLSSLIL